MDIVKNKFVFTLFLLLIAQIITSCSGGGGNKASSAQVNSFELLDPTPGAGDRFGERIRVLPNGNIVVSDPRDSSVAERNGAIHLYNPFTQTLIASFYGNYANDELGEWRELRSRRPIITLDNSNFVITSAISDEGGVIDVGSVRLINGTTGGQIGNTITGDNEGDRIGDVIIALGNNFVIASVKDDVNGIANAGSVKLISGTSGTQIGNTITGDNANDGLGSGVAVLTNNNFVIASGAADVNGIIDAGSVILIDGVTGVQIGNTIAGDSAGDSLGGSGIKALTNNNFLIKSQFDDVAGISDAGSVMLVDGSTGVQIGDAIVGDNTDDRFGGGSRKVIELSNNNIVIASSADDVNGVVDVGSVRMINSVTGLQIGGIISGDVAGDQLGTNVVALMNDNFVIVSQWDDEANIVDAGSIRLINGSTGVQIGNTIAGDSDNDRLGQRGKYFNIVALPNNNFVVASVLDDVAGITDAGSVRLINGTTGVLIGSSLAGDIADDQLGYSGVYSHENSNFVVISQKDDEGGVVNAGSVRLMSGVTGAQIGNSLVGDSPYDQLGSRGPLAQLNNNMVLISPSDEEAGIASAGSARVIDVTTGAQVGDAIVGDNSYDFSNVAIGDPYRANRDDFYILGLPRADNNGSLDSGLVRLITQ